MVVPELGMLEETLGDKPPREGSLKEEETSEAGLILVR